MAERRRCSGPEQCEGPNPGTSSLSRLESLAARAAQGWEPKPEDRKKILMERAKTLARKVRSTHDGSEDLQVVEFLLSGERYGLELSAVREVCPLREFTPLPCTPPFVAGLINVRGRIISVVDLREFFEMPKKGLTELNRVVVLHSDQMEFGILADAILGVRSISRGEIQPPLPTFSGMRADYLKGVTGERLIVLDASRIITDKRLIVHEEAEE